VHSANPKEVRSLRRQTLLDSFVHRESILDPPFRVYFDGTQALSTWLKYRRIVYEYVALSCCDSEARNDVRDIHAFFSDHRSLVSDYPPPPYKRWMPGVMGCPEGRLATQPESLCHRLRVGWLRAHQREGHSLGRLAHDEAPGF